MSASASSSVGMSLASSEGCTINWNDICPLINCRLIVGHDDSESVFEVVVLYVGVGIREFMQWSQVYEAFKRSGITSVTATISVYSHDIPASLKPLTRKVLPAPIFLPDNGRFSTIQLGILEASPFGVKGLLPGGLGAGPYQVIRASGAAEPSEPSELTEEAKDN